MFKQTLDVYQKTGSRLAAILFIRDHSTMNTKEAMDYVNHYIAPKTIFLGK